MKEPVWTDEKIAYLKAHYKTDLISDIASSLDVSDRSAKIMATRYNLPYLVYNKEAMLYMAQAYELGNLKDEDTARRLSITVSALREEVSRMMKHFPEYFPKRSFLRGNDVVFSIYANIPFNLFLSIWDKYLASRLYEDYGQDAEEIEKRAFQLSLYHKRKNGRRTEKPIHYLAFGRDWTSLAISEISSKYEISESRVYREGKSLGKNHRRICSFWNDSEIEILKQYYNIIDDTELLKKLPGRSLAAIKQKAGELGLIRSMRWSKKEDTIIRENYPEKATIDQLCKLLPGRSASAIRTRIARNHQDLLGSKKDVPRKRSSSSNPRKWSEEEDNLLRLHYAACSVESLRKKYLPDRSSASINDRMSFLGLKHPKIWSTDEEALLYAINGQHVLDVLPYFPKRSANSLTRKARTLDLFISTKT